MRRAPALAIGLIVVLAASGLASAATPDKRIHYFKGIGGINVGMSRAKVDSPLKKPQEVFPLMPGLYGANYTDEKISVYYRLKGKSGKKDTKRDKWDRVVAVITFSPQYKGTPSVGDHFTTRQRCTPIDRHEGPDGGPRRVGACYHDGPGTKSAIVYLGYANSRAQQPVSGVMIAQGTLAAAIFSGLMEDALEGLDCPDYDCDG